MTKWLTREDIERCMGCCPPYLMLDRAELDLDTHRASAIKQVSISEKFFCGHFPDQPIMPGVLQVEALTQLASLSFNCFFPSQSKVLFLEKAKNIKFRQPVIPGDTLHIKINLANLTHKRITIKGDIFVEQRLICSADLELISLEPNEKAYRDRSFDNNNHSAKGIKGIVTNIEKILTVMPHRYPFLLLDRVFQEQSNAIDEPIISCIKNLSGNDPYFIHGKGFSRFLSNSFLMELSAQLGCYYVMKNKNPDGRVGYFMTVDHAHFFQPAYPGDQLYAKMRLLSYKKRFGKIQSRIYVDNDLIANIQCKFVIMQ